MGLIVVACCVIFLTSGKATALDVDPRVPPPAKALRSAWCVGQASNAPLQIEKSVPLPTTRRSEQRPVVAPADDERGNPPHDSAILLAADDPPAIADPLNKPVPRGERVTYSRGFVVLKLAMLIAAPLILMSLWMKGIIRPGAFSKGKSKRDVQGLPAVVWLACAFLMFYSQLVGGVLIMLISPELRNDDSMRAKGIMSVVVYLVACGAGALLIYFILPRARNAGFRAGKSDVLTGLGVLLLTMPILEGVNMLGVLTTTWISGHTPDPIAHETLRDLINDRHNPWTWAVMAAAVIGAPIVEELTFRVFLQSAILRATRSHWTAILVSAALFALIHRLSDSPVPWHVLPTLFTLGVAAGIAFERTGRVLVPIIMHASFNALNVAMVFLVM
ncbi:MAG: CPBP family intramembrane metalloprotease [Pyrinomonadaceae bacterium]|nr:CPBP family intramembrane metalloprotease [Phycisphaerales bacterium]